MKSKIYETVQVEVFQSSYREVKRYLVHYKKNSDTTFPVLPCTYFCQVVWTFIISFNVYLKSRVFKVIEIVHCFSKLDFKRKL